MSLYFDQFKSQQAHAVRVGLESDDPGDHERSFWMSFADDEELDHVTEALQRYTRWLDDRGLLNLPKTVTHD